MKIPQNPKERSRKVGLPTIISVIAILVSWALLIQLLNMRWFSKDTFSILIAPPVEEAIKGGIGSLLGILYLIYHAKGRLTRFKPITYAVLAGILSGVIFALSESLMQGESILAIGTGLYTHLIWATGVSIGCWSLILNGNKRFLASIYPLAVAGHISWNYFIYNPSNLTKYLSFLFIVVILVIIFWRYYRNQLFNS